jgi:molecular chaperone GrpE
VPYGAVRDKIGIVANPDDQVPVRVVDRRWWARTDGEETTQDGGARKPTYVEELERRLADQAAQLQEALADRRRSADEFDQVKVRLRRDSAREVERAKRGVFAELLEVLDNLDRAIAAARESASASDPLLKGVELVRDQFLAKLGAFGVTRVPARGEPFDARRHEAITTAPVSDPLQDGLVIDVVREGYAMGDELVRPASVVVGRMEP